jgi:hypothetical protein
MMIWLVLIALGFILISKGSGTPLAEVKASQTTIDPLKASEVIETKLQVIKSNPKDQTYFPDMGTSPTTQSNKIIPDLNSVVELVPPPGYSGPKGGPFTWSQAGNPPDGKWTTAGLPLYK